VIYGGWNNFFIKINIQAFSTCFLTKKFFYKTRGDYFRFHLVFIKKKVTKPNFFFKKTETGSNRPVSVRFSFLGQKPVWLGFSV